MKKVSPKRKRRSTIPTCLVIGSRDGKRGCAKDTVSTNPMPSTKIEEAQKNYLQKRSEGKMGDNCTQGKK